MPMFLRVVEHRTTLGRSTLIQEGIAKNSAEASIIGELATDVRDDLGEDPFIGDVLGWETVVRFVRGGSTHAQSPLHLGISMELAEIDATMHHPSTKSLPTTSDLNLVVGTALLLRTRGRKLTSTVCVHT